ncbi:MAG TPA: HAMP domain-containing sensor histidine kinase [Thermoanaerobaculia bacterium]
MFRRSLSRYTPLLIAAVLVVLLAFLASLQYRWIGQVSAMHRHRKQADLLASSSRFAEDFDREVTRAFLYFHPDPRDVSGRRDRMVRQLDRWIDEAPYPRLVLDVLLVRRDPEGGLSAEVLKPGASGFEPVSSPADLEPFRRHLGHNLHLDHGMPVAAGIPALVIPFPILRLMSDPTTERPPGEHLVVRLDANVISGEILPALTHRYFGDAQVRDYSVAVVAADDPGRVIFQSDPVSSATLRSGGDASLPMFGLRPFDELRSLWRERGIAGTRRHSRSREPHALFMPRGRRDRDGAWKLVLVHRNGSLEQAVARFRRHNLALSGSILILLAAAMGMMVMTTQRAQKLARQQIELVAGVTHELNTPITAIRSAGQNLADGVVADPAQVKRYGELVEKEGRRLSQMVGLMLELSGLQSGRATYSLQPTEVEEVLDEAIADCRWLLEERQARVEKDLDPDLPAVLGDAGALRRALRNLVENAAKYGGKAPWIGVRARAAGREVEVTVEDRGPGIRREDLPHLFEPFYRGREVKTGGIPGSGLGLSVVRRIAEAHRGRVSVAAGGSGQGSAFTLHLPAAPEEAA